MKDIVDQIFGKGIFFFGGKWVSFLAVSEKRC